MKSLWLFTLLSLGLSPSASGARTQGLVDSAKQEAQDQIRRLVEPVLDRFCRTECKLLGVQADIDVNYPDQVAPGFDEVEYTSGEILAPSQGKVSLLINEKIGPVTRGQLTELLQRHLDTLDFPVKIDAQITRFPEPIESATRAAELREKAIQMVRSTLEGLFKQFCPNQCMLGDFELKTESVNPEEIQYAKTGEYLQDGSVAIRIRKVDATVLLDENLSPKDQSNIIELAKLRTNFFRNVDIQSKVIGFPKPEDEESILNADGSLSRIGVRGLSSKTKNDSSEKLSADSTKTETNSNSNSTSNQNTNESKNSTTSNQSDKSVSNSKENSTNDRKEKFERYEKIERVEQGDAIQKELDKFKIYGLVFAVSVLALLIFIAVAGMRKPGNNNMRLESVMNRLRGGKDAEEDAAAQAQSEHSNTDNPRTATAVKNYEIQRLKDELTQLFGEQPRVAKQVFSRILQEEGVEVTSKYIQIFGEGIVVEMLRDPSLQTDIADLMEFYARGEFELESDETLQLLRSLHNRAIAGKLFVLGNRSRHLFEFLVDMDAIQILELIKTESLTVKAIVITQCDPQKRAAIYAQVDDQMRMGLLTELSRIDYLPRDFVYNVAQALKRKKRENPRLNTEALPGSDVLVGLLERTAPEIQREVIKNLEANSPDSVSTIKGKLVSVDTLRYLRDNQLLEVLLSLKHDELLTFLTGSPGDVQAAILAKTPKELVVELREEMSALPAPSREAYQQIERRILSRVKLMAQDGIINLSETNERMFTAMPSFISGGPGGLAPGASEAADVRTLKKAAGW